METPTLASVVAEVISLITTSMTSIGTALMANTIFQYVLGVVIFGIAISVIFYLVKKLKRRGN